MDWTPVLLSERKLVPSVSGKTWYSAFQLLDELEQIIVICQWEAGQLFAEVEGCDK